MKITQIKSLYVDITHPLNMKEQTIDFNALTLMTGPNGSGKTFFMIHAYALAKIAQLVVTGLRGEQLEATSQFILNNSFSDLNTEGTLGIEFGAASLNVVMKKGQIESINWKNLAGIENVAQVRFMSAGMRTFSDMKHYLFSRKMIAQTYNNNMEQIAMEMLKAYKFYDFEYIEQTIQKMPLKGTDKMAEYLASFDIHEKIKEFGVDLDKCEFYLIEEKDGNEEKRNLTSYGAGHQSIINMVIANSFN